VEFSASQVSRFLKCPRQWAFDKLAKVPRQEAEALRFGSALHEQAEKWLRDRIAPDTTTKEGELFSRGIGLLPQPHSGLVVEGELRGGFDGVSFMGRIDLMDPAARAIWDHKTIGNRKWAQTSDSLRRDIQAVLYAALFGATFGPGPVGLCWVYYPKSGGNPWGVPTLVDSESAADFVRKVHVPVGRLLGELRENGSEDIRWINEQIPAFPDSCEYVGRFCDACDVCSLKGNGSIMAETMSEKVARMKAEALARQAAQAAPAAAPVAVAAPPPPPPPPAPVAVAAPVAAPVAAVGYSGTEPADSILDHVAALTAAGFKVTLTAE
jgi:hypothetical protein